MAGHVLVASKGMKLPGGRVVGRGMAVPELEDHPRLKHLLKSKQLDYGDPKKAKAAAAQYKKNCKASDETAERLKRKEHAADHVVPNLVDLLAEFEPAEAYGNLAAHREQAEGGTDKECQAAYEEAHEKYLRDNPPPEDKGGSVDHVVPELAYLLDGGMAPEDAAGEIAGHGVIAKGGTEDEAQLAYKEVRDAYLRDNPPDGGGGGDSTETDADTKGGDGDDSTTEDDATEATEAKGDTAAE